MSDCSDYCHLATENVINICVKQVDTGGDKDGDNNISYYRLKGRGEISSHIMHVSLSPHIIHVCMYNYVEYVDVYPYKVQTQ